MIDKGKESNKTKNENNQNYCELLVTLKKLHDKCTIYVYVYNEISKHKSKMSTIKSKSSQLFISYIFLSTSQEKVGASQYLGAGKG